MEAHMTLQNARKCDLAPTTPPGASHNQVFIQPIHRSSA